MRAGDGALARRTMRAGLTCILQRRGPHLRALVEAVSLLGMPVCLRPPVLPLINGGSAYRRGRQRDPVPHARRLRPGNQAKPAQPLVIDAYGAICQHFQTLRNQVISSSSLLQAAHHITGPHSDMPGMNSIQASGDILLWPGTVISAPSNCRRDATWYPIAFILVQSAPMSATVLGDDNNSTASLADMAGAAGTCSKCGLGRHSLGKGTASA